MQADITLKIICTARDRFRISSLKPYQILVMQRIMEQDEMDNVRHQIVVLPTGTGKSICFQVPAMLCKGISIIVYPLLALMNDQIARLEKAKVPCICIRGGQSREERNELFRRLGNDVKTVVITAESLQNHIVIRELKKHHISLFVVDEAHVISQWGKDFRPAYLGLSSIVRELGPHQILAFTATASERTLHDIRQVLFPTTPLVINGDPDRPNIIYSSYPTLSRTKGVLNLVRKCQRPILVFCRTRSETQALAMALRMECKDIPVRYYHAGLTKPEREQIEDWFMKSEDGVLVATSAYGMGMDKGTIRSVIHHRLPQTVEEYLQESGRAGRDGETSWAWVVVTAEDASAKSPYSPILATFLGDGCRRMSLLRMLGYDKQECYGCDVCLKTRIADMDGDYAIRTLVRRWPFQYTASSAAYMLSSSRCDHIMGLSDRLNPLYGTLTDWNTRMLGDTIRNLCRNDNPYPLECVGFMGKGELLYPPNKLYNHIAKSLRRIDHGYHWIVRKTRRRRKGHKKIRFTGKEPHGSFWKGISGNLLHIWKNRAWRQSHRP